MAKTDLTILSLADKFIDLRDILPGDAYKWNWERPLSEILYLAIHHTGGPANQTPEDLTRIHMDKNGWAGIGYHFLVSNDGLVYYVGDISTARSNVANLNDQVLGIALIGNFGVGVSPTEEQLDGARKLCQFLIDYPDLTGVTGWDAVKGHKELPQQATNCPGDRWDQWKTKLVRGIVFNKPPASADETINYQKSQIDNLQASLASVTGQLINMQETLAQKELEINEMRKELNTKTWESEDHDHTLTLVQALINLYKFILPRKTE